jgi:hypothetical protein
MPSSGVEIRPPIGDGGDLVVGDRRAEVAHHADNGLPAFRRIAGGEPVEVVAVAADAGVW